jgi:hypothetical protein
MCASAIPVFPLVGATSVPPGRSKPSCSASSTRAAATRSLTLPLGLRDSSLTATRPGSPAASRRSSSKGVCPTPSVMDRLRRPLGAALLFSRGGAFMGTGRKKRPPPHGRTGGGGRAGDSRTSGRQDSVDSRGNLSCKTNAVKRPGSGASFSFPAAFFRACASTRLRVVGATAFFGLPGFRYSRQATRPSPARASALRRACYGQLPRANEQQTSSLGAHRPHEQMAASVGLPPPSHVQHVGAQSSEIEQLPPAGVLPVRMTGLAGHALLVS